MNPAVKEMFVRSIFLDLLFTLLTCGLYNVYIQYKQIEAVNFMLEKPKYSFARWAIFSLLTCGLYHIYHEFIMSRDILEKNAKSDSIELFIHVALSIFGLSMITDALQQNEINKFFGKESL